MNQIMKRHLTLKKCTVMCYHQKLFQKECILTLLPPRRFAILTAHIAQRELKIAQIAQVNQPLQLLSSNCMYRHGDGLSTSNTVMRKNVNVPCEQSLLRSS